MDQASQLHTYIQQSRASGLTDSTIKSQLLQAGWSQTNVDGAFNNVASATQSSNPHRVRNGVLWICSPAIVLITVTVLQFLVHFAGLNLAIINIISILGGMAGVILLFVGPIVGIIKLSHNQ